MGSRLLAHKSAFEVIEEGLISAPELGPMSRSMSSFAKLMYLESQPQASLIVAGENEATVVEGDSNKADQRHFATEKSWEQSDTECVNLDVVDADDSTVLTASDSATTTRV